MATKERTTSNVPINYEEQLAAESHDIAKRIAAPTGDRIRFNGAVSFITPDEMEGDELEVVILDFASTNLFYDSAYDRDNPQPPACFAIGEEPSLLAPSKNSPDIQAESCSVCPNNQFGSASNGKGKACKNTRLIAVMPVAALESEEEAPIWTMSIPPTSIKSFDSYVHSLAVRHSKAPVSVVTSITMDKKSTYAAPRFEVRRPLDNEELGVFMPRRDEARQRLHTEPDVSMYKPPEEVSPRQVKRAGR
jgi:hypothetical protein